MACFQRFFRHRNKNSFSPREDENIDPIVNNNDNSVQIGRYIRREEKPVFTPLTTPSSSEAYLQKQQSIVPTTITVTSTPIPTPTASTTPETTPTITENEDPTKSSLLMTKSCSKTSSFGSNSLKKKFKSNKDKFLNKDKNNNSNSNRSSINSNSNSNKTNINAFIISNNSTSNNNRYSNSKDVKSNAAINVTLSNSKLKPVKERRPTALPSEVPHIEHADGSGKDSYDGSHVREAHKKPQLKLLVNGMSTKDYNDLPFKGVIASNVWPLTPTPSPTPSPTSNKENVKFFIGGNGSPLDDASMKSIDSFLLTIPSTTKLVNGYLKSSSNASLNYQKLSPRNDGTNKARWQRVSTAPDLNIPTPPPMPAELYVPSTPLCVRKKKSAASSSAKTILDSNSTLDALSKSSNASKDSKSSYAFNCYSLTTNDADIAKFTFTELLKFDVDIAACNSKPSTVVFSSFHTISTVGSCASSSSKNMLSHFHSVSSDSGVQSVEQTVTPKLSSNDSLPKSQRLEHGLIFARPNLPAKKHIEIPFIEKDESTRKLIRTAIERNDFLNNLMDKERKEMVINAMAPANYDKDSYIILEKEEGSEIYVSAEGYYDVIKDGKHVGNFGPATVFGELAILYNAPRQATIKAATSSRVWKMARETFRAIMQVSGCREREENLNFLRSAPFLQELGETVLNKVVDLLQRKFYETNSCIVREGEVGNEFFIIRGGTVTIKKLNEEGSEYVVNRRKRGDYFGEQALLNADRRQASVYADAPGTEVLKLDRKAFKSYLGTIPQLREKPSEDIADRNRSSNKSNEFDNEYANIPISELKKVTTLGAGAFGRVDLVTHNKKAFALKIIKKIEVVKSDQIEHVYNEKNVMMKCRNSAFIVELYRTYRNEKYIYFLMEVCMGGDVWTAMSRRQHFDDKTAKFIAACVVEAFDFLHSHNFVYRDLKPENLMFTVDGYCKLADFGFAKHVRYSDKTNTFAGTPEYVAPEIILDRGHDRAVDYWALGILIFELLVGKTPFRGLNQIKIYQQILSGIDVIHMPARISRSAQGLIKHLCKQLPAERLGYQRRGIQDIKRHNWFDGIDWSKLKQKQLQSPIKRPINSPTDLQYFEPSVIENDYEPPDDLSGWDKDF